MGQFRPLSPGSLLLVLVNWIDFTTVRNQRKVKPFAVVWPHGGAFGHGLHNECVGVIPFGLQCRYVHL